jgi:hypothetical protein
MAFGMRRRDVGPGRLAGHCPYSPSQPGDDAKYPQNLFLAFVYNVVSVPVVAGVFYPVIGMLSSPMWTSAAITLSFSR